MRLLVLFIVFISFVSKVFAFQETTEIKAQVPFEIHTDKSVRFTESYSSALSSDSTVVILFNGNSEFIANLIRDAAILAEKRGIEVKKMVIGKPHEDHPQSFVIYEAGQPIYNRIKADSLAGLMVYEALRTKHKH